MNKDQLENILLNYFRNFQIDYSLDMKDLYENIFVDEKKKISFLQFKEHVDTFLKGGKKSVLEQNGELISLNKVHYNSNSEIEEEKMYPPIKNWLLKYKNIDAKILDQRTAKTKKGESGIWWYPDLIGIYYNIKKNQNHLTDIVASIGKNAGSPLLDIYSFEVKIELNYYNIRKHFFQCLANSAWANKRYLIAEKIDEKALLEFNKLSRIYNIGLIKIGMKKKSENEWDYTEDSHIINECIRNQLDIEMLLELSSKWNDLNDWFEDLKKNDYV
jgi:hypothetical protein